MSRWLRFYLVIALAIIAMLVPVSGVFADTQFWTGQAGVTVIDPIEVYSDAGCTHLIPTGQNYAVSAGTKLGDTRTVNLWIKNTSGTMDYTITPAVVLSEADAFGITGITPIVVNKSTVGSFSFNITALKAGTYSITLNLSHN